jgi:hypothetical protein
MQACNTLFHVVRQLGLGARARIAKALHRCAEATDASLCSIEKTIEKLRGALGYGTEN